MHSHVVVPAPAHSHVPTTFPLSLTLSHFLSHIYTEARCCPQQCAASLCALLAALCACSTSLINDTNTGLFPPLCLSSGSHTGLFDTLYLAVGVWNYIWTVAVMKQLGSRFHSVFLIIDDTESCQAVLSVCCFDPWAAFEGRKWHPETWQIGEVFVWDRSLPQPVHTVLVCFE